MNSPGKKVVVRPKSRGRKLFETDGCLFKRKLSLKVFSSNSASIHECIQLISKVRLASWHLGNKRGHLFEMDRGCNLDYQERALCFSQSNFEAKQILYHRFFKDDNRPFFHLLNVVNFILLGSTLTVILSNMI